MNSVFTRCTRNKRKAARAFTLQTGARLPGAFCIKFIFFAKETTELCAYLCRQYNLDHTKDGVLICHAEGYKRDITSNHADVMFPEHGKSKDTFRTDVKKLLDTASTSPTPASTEPKKLFRIQVGAFSVKANAHAMLKKVRASGFTNAFNKTE